MSTSLITRVLVLKAMSAHARSPRHLVGAALSGDSMPVRTTVPVRTSTSEPPDASRYHQVDASQS
ncbi:hypothetical protein AB6O49_19265 [Streptomyces sp. SBR177]